MVEGAAEFGGHKLMREDLVVVTVEYRTGLMGFLSDETKNMPGNLALSDVALALTWVQQAIAEFGGNPQSVTLAGFGQGAVIAHLLSLNQATASNNPHRAQCPVIGERHLHICMNTKYVTNLQTQARLTTFLYFLYVQCLLCKKF